MFMYHMIRTILNKKRPPIKKVLKVNQILFFLILVGGD